MLSFKFHVVLVSLDNKYRSEEMHLNETIEVTLSGFC